MLQSMGSQKVRHDLATEQGLPTRECAVKSFCQLVFQLPHDVSTREVVYNILYTCINMLHIVSLSEFFFKLVLLIISS